MKKLFLAMLAGVLGGAALGAWTEIELEGGADRRAGFLGKVAEIQPAGSNGVAAIRATWTNVSEVSIGPAAPPGPHAVTRTGCCTARRIFRLGP